MSEPVANSVFIKENDALQYLIEKSDTGEMRVTYDKLFSAEEQEKLELPTIFHDDNHVFLGRDGTADLEFFTNWEPPEELYRKLSEKTDFKAEFNATNSYGAFEAVGGQILCCSYDTIFAGDDEYCITAQRQNETTFAVYSCKADEPDNKVMIGTADVLTDSIDVHVEAVKMFEADFDEEQVEEYVDEVNLYLNSLVEEAVLNELSKETFAESIKENTKTNKEQKEHAL